MNEIPFWRQIRGVPPSTNKPTRMMFAVDPVTGKVRLWNLQTWVELAETPVNVAIYMNSTAGSDANPGTALAPVKTLAAALALVPPTWSGSCKIIDALATGGTYTMPSGATWGQPYADGDPLVFEGVLVPEAFATQTPPGVVRAVSHVTTGDNMTLRDDTLAGLGVDDFAGYYLRVTTGVSTAVGQRFLIRSSTANGQFLLVNGAMAAYPQVGDHFVIEHPATTIAASLLVGQTFAMRHVVLAGAPAPFVVVQDCHFFIETTWLSASVWADGGFASVGTWDVTTYPVTGYLGTTNSTTGAGGIALRAGGGISAWSMYMDVMGVVGSGASFLSFAIGKYRGAGWDLACSNGGLPVVAVYGCTLGLISTWAPVRCSGTGAGDTGILVDENAFVSCYGVEVYSCTSHGIVVRGRSVAHLFAVVSTGGNNGGVGVAISEGSRVMVDNQTAITGASGPCSIDGTIVPTWANYRDSGILSKKSGASMDAGTPTGSSDTSAAPGAATAYALRGKCAVANGQTTVVITHALCKTTSGITATSNTAGHVVASVEPGNGSFTITIDVAAGAAGSVVSWDLTP